MNDFMHWMIKMIVICIGLFYTAFALYIGREIYFMCKENKK